MVLSGLDSKSLDDLKATIDSMIEAQKYLAMSVKHFMARRGDLKGMLLVSDKLETRTWNNPSAVQRLRDLQGVARGLDKLTVQSVVDEALDDWTKNGWSD